MSIEALRDRLPDYAKDIRLNLGTLASETTLTEQQKWGVFLASAYASRSATTLRAISREVDGKLSPEAANAARAAAAIMAMNNVYYRFLHLVNDPEYGSLPAKLRMSVIGKPGVAKADFELMSLAVSAVNGCGMCITAHEKTLRAEGLGREAIQSAVRIAAVVAGVANTLAYAAAA